MNRLSRPAVFFTNPASALPHRHIFCIYAIHSSPIQAFFVYLLGGPGDIGRSAQAPFVRGGMFQLWILRKLLDAVRNASLVGNIFLLYMISRSLY